MDKKEPFSEFDDRIENILEHQEEVKERREVERENQKHLDMLAGYNDMKKLLYEKMDYILRSFENCEEAIIECGPDFRAALTIFLELKNEQKCFVEIEKLSTTKDRMNYMRYAIMYRGSIKSNYRAAGAATCFYEFHKRIHKWPATNLLIQLDVEDRPGCISLELP